MKMCGRREFLVRCVCRNRWCRAENERCCPHGRREPKSSLKTIEQKRETQIVRLGVKRAHITFYRIAKGRRQRSMMNRNKRTSETTG